MAETILLVDDSSDLTAEMRALLARREPGDLGLEHVTAGPAAVEAVRGGGADLVMLALDAEGIEGLEVLDRIRDSAPALPVIVVTGRDRLEDAIEAMQRGAHDFVVRSAGRSALKGLVEEHLSSAAGQEELEVPTEPADGEDRLLGRSQGIIEVCRTVGRVAPTDATVLISGESGTGKELIAGLLHKNSDRWQGPYRTVNCGAIPDNLLESELFGHEKGAFTGADARRKGKFEAADGGTLFLDEIGDMAASHQKKILRALEERAIERVGGNETIDVDVRVVAATNVDLWKRVKEGEFRRDLYYRLAVVNLRVPPLRERKEDIEVLTDHFVARFARRSGRPVKRIDREVYERLRRYDWPGNVRELRNVLERAVIMGRGEVLEADSLPELTPGEAAGREPGRVLRELCQEGVSLEGLERRYIESVLDEHGWHYGDAADVLQIHRNTLRRKMQRYGLDEETSSGR